MKIAYRFIFGVLLSFAALHTQAAPYFASKDGSMIWDQATGLVWARCSLGQQWDGKTCAGKAGTYKFDEVQATAKQFNATGGLGGFADWIVPTIRQLASLRACSAGFEGARDLEDNGASVPKQCSVGHVNPTIDTNTFPSTPVEAFWSASPYVGNASNAWVVYFYDGDVGNGYRGYSYYVRLVRASQLSGDEAESAFPNKVPPIELVWQQQKEAQEKQRKEAALKAEQERRAAEIHAEKERRAAEAARAAALKKLITSGAQAIYLQAGKAQRSGSSISVNGVISLNASELYELIIDKFPSSEYAVKATDQLSAMGRSEQQANALREADRNASSRASCFSSVRRCEANCSGGDYCIRGCQRSCN